MSEVIDEFSISVQQIKDYQFLVEFDKNSMAALHTDEGPPLGKDAGPSPSRLLAAAVGNCLAASLLFACNRAGVPTANIHADVKVQVVRNEKRRLRIGKMEVALDPHIAAGFLDKAAGTRAIFEDFCTVTRSVQAGFPVEVKVKGIDGE